MEQPQAHADARGPALAGFFLTLLNALQFAFTLLWTAGWISVSLCVQLVTGRPDLALRMARACWAPLLLDAAGGLTVDGAEAIDWSRPYLVVANHQSILDICVVFRAVPVPLRFLLKDEMRRVPFVNWYAQATGMLFITRDDRRSGPLLRRQAAGVLQAGQMLCLFPEGTRARDGRLAEFKSGSFQAAIDAGVEVLPIAIHGTGDVLPAVGFFCARRGPMRATIGKPLSTTGCVGAAGRQTIARQAHDAVAAMLAGR
ncbi:MULTISPECIES: lysophospholipid acyltransferase family protein [Luteimonas]|jgi:1-acyl-sn-glycerol-3-phosphate acyltransferase|uniref:lysophospholipid acyltransferase family protein n=2 Tax=Gammaproteobacteria TaxID=1236 RepID=UPI000C7E43B5|nr:MULTISPECIES: lysophospholipid acyltransferase family protein [Luteimonas]